jgi:alpha-L-rhamnosidase
VKGLTDLNGAIWIWHPEAVRNAAARRTSMEGGNLQDAVLFTGGANNFYVLVRHEFEVVDPPTVRLWCSANDLYEVWLNGVWIGRGPSPSDPSYAYVDPYDLGSCARKGRNVIAFLAFNQGEGSDHPQYQTLMGPGGLLYRVEADGRSVAVSGPESRMIQAPHIQRGTDPLRTTVWGYEEVWNTGLEPTAWREAGFDDSDWLSPVESQFAPDTLIERPMPHLVRWPSKPVSIVSACGQGGRIDGVEGILAGQAVRVDASKPMSLPRIVFDFGREVVGFPRFDIEGHGGFLTISYGETLEMERYDTVVPNGRVTWGPYHRRAFRYMAIEVFQFANLVIHEVRVDCVNAPLIDRGSFECSDPTLEAIWELGRYTLQTATQDYYEADAWRERAAWFCGSEHRLAAVTFGIDEVARETLRMLARIQDSSGFIPATGPVRNTTILPDIDAYWVKGLSEIVLYTGDLAFGRELLPNLIRLLDWWHGERDAEGLLNMDGKPWWVHIDWSRLDRRGEVAMVNLRYLEALDDAIALTGWLGESGLVNEWGERADALRARCRERFRDPDSGIYMDCFAEGVLSSWTSQHTNALAVLTRTAAGDEARRVMRHVLDPELLPKRARPFQILTDGWGGWFQTIIDQTGYGEPKGINYPAKIGYAATGFSAGWIVDALFQADMDAEAVELMRFHWGEQIARGSTTGWEIFDPYSQRSAVPWRLALGTRLRTSHCHVYSVLPAYLLSRYVLGVRPLEPGFVRFEVDPRPAGLSWARGKMPTPHGDIAIGWRGDGGRLLLGLTVPPGATAVLKASGGAELQPGRHEVELSG